MCSSDLKQIVSLIPKQRTRTFRIILIFRESRRTLDNFMLLLSFAHHLFCFGFHSRRIVQQERNRQDNEIASTRRCERKPICFPDFCSSPLSSHRQEGFLFDSNSSPMPTIQKVGKITPANIAKIKSKNNHYKKVAPRIAPFPNKNAMIIPYEFHELCCIFPRCTDEELQLLVSDIRENGLLTPITLFEGKILDERNRYRYLACQMFNMEPEYVEFDGKDPLPFVVSRNLCRRIFPNRNGQWLRRLLSNCSAKTMDGRKLLLAKAASHPRSNRRSSVRLIRYA